jgi:hypothetical protein
MTDDDVCGAECVDGTTCQHPAGSCPVPSHSDSNAENPHGRPSKYTEDRADAAIDAARDGASKTGCARAAGVDRATLNRWLDARDGFRTAFARARGEGERRLIRDGLGEEVSPQMAKFLLATSYGYTKTEKREIEGDVSLDGVVVDFTPGGDE